MSIKTKITNVDFIPISLSELEGIGRFIDVEDLFIKCYELSPERFGWRKYKYPNYKILHKALTDFEEKYPEFIIKTPDGLSRQLTAEGVEWTKNRLPIFRKLLQSPEIAAPKKRPNQKILNEIAVNNLFIDFSEGRKPELDKFEVADLLLCSPDSPSALWNERLISYKSTAEDSKRTDLVDFFDYLIDDRPDWFGGD